MDNNPPLAISYTSRASTVRDPQYRLIHHKDGFTELYDHQSSAKETKNIAPTHPEVVERLTKTLKSKRAI
ncbi:hypothetical protein [Rubritalea tangerina]|uniref:hypothetical protein n=1 Tax=Rubritalea tangerina TaxID=430798 RepID=UPI00361DDB10